MKLFQKQMKISDKMSLISFFMSYGMTIACMFIDIGEKAQIAVAMFAIISYIDLKLIHNAQ